MADLQKYKQVNSCETISELQKVIISFADADGQIQGRTRKFDAKKMAEGAYEYFMGNVEPNCMTREFGIRQQAMYIKYYEPKF